MKKLLRFLLTLAATTVAVSAFAQTGTAIPGGNQSATYVIAKPGRYYLAAHRVMTDPNKNAIEIASDDVTLDLNGHTVAFATSSGTGNGIYGKDIQNTEIRGGSVVAAPQSGIFIDSTDNLTNSSNTRIIDVRSSQAGYIGIRITGNALTIDRCSVDEAAYHGISAYWGRSILVQNCMVNKTGGHGISGGTESILIKNCIVSQAARSGVHLASHGTVENCHISSCNTLQMSSHAGISLGSYSIARNNTVAICYLSGIHVAGSNNLVDGNAIDAVSGAAAITGSHSATGLMINNRYMKGSAIAIQLTNGGGNLTF